MILALLTYLPFIVTNNYYLIVMTHRLFPYERVNSNLNVFSTDRLLSHREDSRLLRAPVEP